MKLLPEEVALKERINMAKRMVKRMDLARKLRAIAKEWPWSRQCNHWVEATSNFDGKVFRVMYLPQGHIMEHADPGSVLLLIDEQQVFNLTFGIFSDTLKMFARMGQWEHHIEEWYNRLPEAKLEARRERAIADLKKFT